MKMKSLLIVFFVLGLNMPTWSQETESTQTLTPHYLGLRMGATTGLGFSYKYQKNKLGFQFSGIPLFLQDYQFYSVGGSFNYIIKDNQKTDFFTYLGVHSITFSEQYLGYNDQGQTVNIKDTYQLINVGLGLGFKFDFLGNLTYQFQGGYGVYNLMGDFDEHLTISAFTLEHALYYHL